MALYNQEIMSALFYYMSEGYPHHVVLLVQSSQKLFSNDLTLKLHLGVAVAEEGKFPESIKIFTDLKDKDMYSLPSLLALVHVHRKCNLLDHDSVKEFESKIRELRRSSSDMTLYFAALVLYFFRKYDKAREYIQRALKANLLLNEALCLHGWIDLASTDEAVRKKAVRFFEEPSNDDTPTNLCCLMAKARYFQLFHSCVPALELMNVTIVKFPKFIPALIEKMRLQIILNDWEQAMDASQRCLAMDANSIEALKCQVLYHLCSSGNLSEARQKLGELETALDYTEPHYPQHRYIIAKSFAALCGRDPVFLQKLAQISERAIELDAGNHQYPIAHGRVLLMLGRYKEAAKRFYSTLEFDDTSVTGLCGTLHCLLAQDNLKEASAQLEFLNELRPTIGKSAELCYLAAVLGRKQSMPGKKIIAHLDEAIDLHFREIEGIIRDLDYYAKLNPDFLLQLVREYMLHAPQQPPGSFHMSRTDSSGQKDVALIQCLRILDYLANVVPGHQEAQYLRAKVYYLTGDTMTALSAIKTCLGIDPTLVDGHILSAQIHLYQSDLKMAEQALETGLSYNFEVHNHPLYQLVRARLLLKQGSAKAAVQVLKQTISSLNTGNATITGKRLTVADGSSLSVADRLSLSLELADAHCTLGEFPEATKVLQDAQMSYTGGPEAGRITIAMADLALSQGDHETALNRLRTIGPDHAYYLMAKQHMAEIYLHHRKEKKLYAACYREMADKLGTTEANLMLGDAYMSIQEPERAIEIYEAVLRKDPTDARLASKMGQALMKTHNYAKAVSYYEAAVKGGQKLLQWDLADLLIKLKHHDKAKRILSSLVTHDTNEPSSAEFSSLLRSMRLLFKLCIFEEVKAAEYLDLMERTKVELTRRMTRRQTVAQEDTVAEQRLVLADVCLQLAKLHQKVYNQAGGERILPLKDRPRSKNEDRSKGDADSNGVPVGNAPQHIEAAVVLCQEAIGHVATVVGKADPHRPHTISVPHSAITDGRQLSNIQQAAIKVEASALATLSLLYLLSTDYASCEQQILKLAQLQEEMDADNRTPCNKEISASDPRSTTGVPLTNLSVVSSHDIMDGVPMASFLMGELSFVKADFDAAGKHFEKVLQKSPTDYQTLTKAIEAFRRAGKLEQATKLLENAKQSDPKNDSSAGYNYCQGLYYWATREHNLALQHLNRCRLDKGFAEDAVHLMVDVYLTPEFQPTYMETNGSNQSAHGSISSNAAALYSDTMHMPTTGDSLAGPKHDANVGYETVNKLLKSLPMVRNEKRHQFLCNLVPLLTGSKSKIEISLEAFAQRAHDEPDSSAIVYGAAACFMALRQTQKARNQLKRLAKIPWTAQDAEVLEKSWLLLAHIYIQNGKQDLGQELLKRCLQYNKSCVRACELMGYILEKDQNFVEAVRNYEQAWRVGNRHDPKIGFRLAYSYLRNRQFVEAIEVCLQVLATYPTYPKIRSDILDKARSNLRC